MNSRKKLHWIFNTVFGVSVFCSAALFPAVLKVQSDSLPPILKSPLIGLQGQLWWLFVLTFVLAFLAKSADKRICDQWGHETVKEMLDILRDVGFPGSQDPVHYHRVTLFRYRKWWPCLRVWPWSGWLVPVVRSGHTTLNHRTCFLAPDDADQAEGVAGRCWSTKSVVLVPSEGSKVPLPQIHDEEQRPHDPRVPADTYARATFVSTDWVLKMKPHSRSFLGIPVVVHGAPWGVIIVDSRGNAIQRAKEIYTSYLAIARPFIKCLERLP
jgi:hypothetical protein